MNGSRKAEDKPRRFTPPPARQIRFLFAVAAALLTSTPQTGQAAGPDKERGRQLIRELGCSSCHSVPGVQGPAGNVGPPLAGIGSRVYVAGMLRKTTDSLIEWIRFPQKIIPGNAMPNMGISDADARDIVAYLDTLK